MNTKKFTIVNAVQLYLKKEAILEININKKRKLNLIHD